MAFLKVKILKSFSSKIHCGEIDIKTRTVNGRFHDLKNGTTTSIGIKHRKPFKGRALFSCINENGTITLNNYFGYASFYSHVPNVAQLVINSTRKITIDNYAKLYELLPEPLFCADPKKMPERIFVEPAKKGGPNNSIVQGKLTNIIIAFQRD